MQKDFPYLKYFQQLLGNSSQLVYEELEIGMVCKNRDNLRA